MDKSEKIEAYYSKEHHFKEGINQLRVLALKTEAEETYKWSLPVYTINNKNVFGICRFKDFFGVWFFNGALLSDQKKVLRNAQEGKTKAMRHWNFTSSQKIDENGVFNYMNEAIQNQKDGKVLVVGKPQKKFEIPEILKTSLSENPALKKAYDNFSLSKQREFCEYIQEAKQAATKSRRIDKILPMIKDGVGLHDRYR
ncbi:YdeI/OmpD-associated family protein [Allomuricauda sp. d1]|uniref:YdeI/OmpD-associated family protein n=1 Tax=Allomuricauda sp. d1 TaxID=3136725 RepID=UPI0031D0D90C